MHLAVRTGQTTRVRQLLDIGSNPNSFDSAGDTTLFLAARIGHEAVAKQLVKEGQIRI